MAQECLSCNRNTHLWMNSERMVLIECRARARQNLKFLSVLSLFERDPIQSHVHDRHFLDSLCLASAATKTQGNQQKQVATTPVTLSSPCPITILIPSWLRKTLFLAQRCLNFLIWAIWATSIPPPTITAIMKPMIRWISPRPPPLHTFLRKPNSKCHSGPSKNGLIWGTFRFICHDL